MSSTVQRKMLIRACRDPDGLLPVSHVEKVSKSAELSIDKAVARGWFEKVHAEDGDLVALRVTPLGRHELDMDKQRMETFVRWRR